ncbi:MAG: KEOPS complex kinase/ATPase Bud32 [Candidatus Micrarchaeaceae archaeon]
MEIIGEGAEAVIYSAKVFGINAVIKYRPKKAYRQKELDELLREQRTRAEAKAMLAAMDAKVNVPGILLVDTYSICMERIEGSNLSSIGEGDKFFAYIEQAGAFLERMHRRNIAHGDYTPANIIAKKNTIYVIDFGLSSFSAGLEDKAIDLLLMKRSVSKEAFAYFEKGYGKEAHKAEFEALKEIESRGRYKDRKS